MRRSRRNGGTSLPARVVPTTMRVLDLLDRAGVTATFFVVGWVAEHYPALVSHDRRSRA